jgi:SAM-dependent methyltransferase/tetratricopeptide (TPR) repeat protein
MKADKRTLAVGQNKIAPDSVKASQALCLQARAHIQNGNLGEAEACLRQALAAANTAEAHHYSGVVHYLRGDREGAIAGLQAALAVDPAYHRSLANLAVLADEAGDRIAALQYVALALKADPENIGYRNSFVAIIGQANLLAFNADLKALIALCLESDDLYHDHLVVPWYSLLKSDPDFQPMCALIPEKDYGAFLRAFLKLKDPRKLIDPFFVGGVKRLIVANREFERFLTHLRRFLLDSLKEKPGLWQTPDFDVLWCALAQYCFHTEYIFDHADEERKRVETLRSSVEASPTQDPASRHAAFALACYLPLGGLRNAATLGKALAAHSAAAGELARIQIDEPREDEKIRSTIPLLTPIDDEISRAVRGQYESFPYPRWKTMSTALSFEDDIGKINDGAEILVAGCGTGHEAAQLAAAFPAANVLAIDLSLSSLSYAVRKAREMKLTNITFGQADILELARLNKTFDLISSTGVLHHIGNPAAGWAVLARLLKPGGFMRIGLYSRTARRAFIAAQEMIARKKFRSDAEGIRKFRRDAPDLLDRDALARLANMRDYYSLSECRDLLFHVMENRFDIPEIGGILQKLGLQFIKFTAADEVRQRYVRKFPADPPGGSLRHWHDFEQENPDTFVEMYNFWCRRQREILPKGTAI